MPVKNSIAQNSGTITEWRRYLHQHPELMYDVHETAAFVADKLRSFGADEIVTGIGRTGVVAVIKGRTDAKGRVIGLRADMDALPISEASGVDYASTVPGKMHACGHDGHTAILLGVAQYLTETRNFDGTAVLIFQPAEEGGAGGRAMVEDGLMDRWNIQEVYGLHNSPGIPVGHFAIRPGPLLASSDEFEIVVTGKGGHAAAPHEAVDTTLVAAQIVVALQSVVSRNTDPQQAVVVSVTSFRTESEAFNVIPEHAVLRGTVRSFDMDVRAKTLERIKAIAELTAQSYGAEAELGFDEEPYPVMVNHDVETEHCIRAARDVAGGCIDDAPRTTGGEDFAYMLQACAGAYIQLGIGQGPGLHHPQYDFNDDVIPTGCSYWVALAEQRLPA